MIQNIYSILDVKSGAYGVPFFAKNNSIACRSFFRLLDDPDSMCSYAPADYRLYHVGGFDDDSGSLAPTSEPVLVFDGATRQQQASS